MNKADVVQQLLEQIDHQNANYIAIIGNMIAIIALVLAVFAFFQWKFSDKQLKEVEQKVKNKLEEDYELSNQKNDLDNLLGNAKKVQIQIEDLHKQNDIIDKKIEEFKAQSYIEVINRVSPKIFSIASSKNEENMQMLKNDVLNSIMIIHNSHLDVVTKMFFINSINSTVDSTFILMKDMNDKARETLTSLNQNIEDMIKSLKEEQSSKNQ